MTKLWFVFHSSAVIGGGVASRFKADYFHTNILKKKKKKDKDAVLYASVMDKLTLWPEGDSSPLYLQYKIYVA